MLIPVLRTLATRFWRHKGELLAVVVLVAVAGEVYLRLPFGRQLEYQPDPELVGVLAPGQRSARETVNRDGHRGKDTDWSAPVILAVGDSQGWGAGVADDEVWTARLEQRLKRGRAYTAFQVVNASHPGHGPYHHYLRARRVLEKHRVDLLLVRVSLEDWNFRPAPPKQVPELIESARFRQAVRSYTKFLPFLANRAQEQLVSIRATFTPKSAATAGPPTLDKGRRMCAENGQWWDRIADLAEEHDVPVVFFLYDPTDLPGSQPLNARLGEIADRHPDVHLYRMGSRAFGLSGSTPEAINREFRARFTLPHDPHANALQHDRIAREVHAFLVNSGLLADVSARRRSLHAER
jgi:hypothetical protein